MIYRYGPFKPSRTFERLALLVRVYGARYGLMYWLTNRARKGLFEVRPTWPDATQQARFPWDDVDPVDYSATQDFYEEGGR